MKDDDRIEFLLDIVFFVFKQRFIPIEFESMQNSPPE